MCMGTCPGGQELFLGKGKDTEGWGGGNLLHIYIQRQHNETEHCLKEGEQGGMGIQRRGALVQGTLYACVELWNYEVPQEFSSRTRMQRWSIWVPRAATAKYLVNPLGEFLPPPYSFLSLRTGCLKTRKVPLQLGWPKPRRSKMADSDLQTTSNFIHNYKSLWQEIPDHKKSESGYCAWVLEIIYSRKRREYSSMTSPSIQWIERLACKLGSCFSILWQLDKLEPLMLSLCFVFGFVTPNGKSIYI